MRSCLGRIFAGDSGHFQSSTDATGLGSGSNGGLGRNREMPQRCLQGLPDHAEESGPPGQRMDSTESNHHAHRNAIHSLLGRVAEIGLEQPRVYQELEAFCAKDLLRATGERSDGYRNLSFLKERRKKFTPFPSATVEQSDRFGPLPECRMVPAL